MRKVGLGNRVNLMQITHDLRIGGLQQVVVNICRSVDREKFNVSVLCLRERGQYVNELEQIGIKVLSLPQRKSGTDYLSFLKVAEVLKREQIDVIHTHNTQPLIDGTIGALLSGVGTVVHTDHARTFPDKRRYMAAEWLMSKFVYKIAGVSEHTCRNLIQYEKIDPRKVMVIRNGIDDSKYEIQIDEIKKRKTLALPDTGPVVGIGARLIRGKGIEYLLEAMPEIIKVFPNVSLVIAGEGPFEEDLRRRCFDLQIDRNVFFLGPRMDIPELLKLFDLYVLPSLSEGLPMGLLEAMASGCPVIATNVGGIPSAISNGLSGSLIPPMDSGALASEVISLLSNPELMKHYSDNARVIFKKNFGAHYMTRTYEQLYLREL